MQANDTLVTHNAFRLSRQLDYLNYMSWDHEIPLQDPNTKIPTGAISKTTWEGDEALQTYLR